MVKHTLITILSAVAMLTSPGASAGELPYDMDGYIGALGGWGGSRIWSNHDPVLTQRENTSINRHAYSAFAGLYAGMGYGLLAGEIGWMTEPGYHSFVVAADPDRHTVQTITGDALYARALLRAPKDWTARPYAFAGAARVHSVSREVGSCAACGVGYVPDFRVSMSATRPYVGAGIEVSLWGPVSGRIEYGYIPRASSSFWSGTRDYTLGSMALQVRF